MTAGYIHGPRHDPTTQILDGRAAGPVAMLIRGRMAIAHPEDSMRGRAWAPLTATDHVEVWIPGTQSGIFQVTLTSSGTQVMSRDTGRLAHWEA